MTDGCETAVKGLFHREPITAVVGVLTGDLEEGGRRKKKEGRMKTEEKEEGRREKRKGGND